jgi:hypothetical protein
MRLYSNAVLALSPNHHYHHQEEAMSNPHGLTATVTRSVSQGGEKGERGNKGTVGATSPRTALRVAKNQVAILRTITTIKTVNLDLN